MNIFYLDQSPKKAARYHVDDHVVKMILETAQILCTATQRHLLCEDEDNLYQPTHTNHPCCKWVSEARGNFIWTLNLGIELNEEYQRRYGNGNHKSLQKLALCLARLNDLTFPSRGMTKPKLAMPDEYKQTCPIQSYRDYYQGEKNHLAKWTKRAPPKWWELQ